jgi:nucleotide-binding universal stress UspA family protein
MQNGNLKFKTIVVATDLRYAASSALRYAQCIARIHGSTLVVVHVIDPIAYAFPHGAPAFQAADQAAFEELKRIEEETSRLGIPVHSIMETGTVCERILQAIEDHNGDLLVLGTRGKTAAGRVALGTVARQLLARASCPIMTVSPEADATLPWVGCWRRVLAATDFSPASIAGLRCAHQVALRQLIALHVSNCQETRECSRCQGRLRFFAPFNESHTVPVEHIVTPGHAGEKIVEYAWKYAVDLVVLGSPTNELVEEDFQTSTVLHVISNVSCPVLCVPVAKTASPVELIRAVAMV